MENFLSSNEVFTVDLSGSKSPADVIFELSHVLDNNKAFGKNIYLKLANIDLSQSQLLSLKSLISSINSKLSFIECPSSMTIASAQSIGIETPSNPPVNQIIEENKQEETTEFINPPQESEEPQLSDAEIEAKKYINLNMFNQSPDFAAELPNQDNNGQYQEQYQEPAQENYQEENFEQQYDVQNNEQNYEQQEQNWDNQNQDIQINENNWSENQEYNECQNCNDCQENNEWQNNQEQTLDDFAPHYEEKNEQNQNYEPENNNIDFEQNVESNFQNSSINLEEIAQNSQTENVDNALDDIFATEKKLEHILEAKEERTTIDLCEPLDNTYTQEDEQIEKMSVKYVKQTVRSGNVISSDGNLIIIGDCHPGSEIHAAGDITVWGLLGGIAHAGNKGNKKAKVRALKLNPIQLRIANLYTRRPDALHTIFVEKTSTFTPEEARIINDEIVIYTMNEK